MRPVRELLSPSAWFAASEARNGALLGTPRRRVVFLGATGLLVAGLIAVLVSVLSGSPTPPTPPAPVAQGGPETSAAPSSSASSTPKSNFHCSGPGDSKSDSPRPVRICIPSIHVDADVTKLGLNPDRTVEVPPLSKVREAGWYEHSALPGTVGPTVVLGHIDSAQYGDGVFYHLGQLKTGARIVLTGGNRQTTTYQVGKVQQVPKSSFPTQAVYGGTSGPAIRLVTCGGQFDSSAGSYLDSIIAYGTLVSRGRV